MNFVALKMLTGDRAKYLALIFAIAFSTFLLENQMSIFAGILKRTGSQIADVSDASIWVMDSSTEYFEQTKALKDTDLDRVRSVGGVDWAVKLYKGTPVARTPAGRFATTFCIGVDDATLTGVPRKMVGFDIPIGRASLSFNNYSPARSHPRSSLKGGNNVSRI